MPTEKSPLIRVTKGKASQRQFTLTLPVLKIGSAGDADLCLLDKKVAPVHVMLQKTGSTHVVIRYGDKPVLVNGVNVEQRVLQHNDEIAVGDCVLRYQVPGMASTRSKKSVSPVMWLLCVVYLVLMSGVIVALLGGEVEGEKPSVGERLQGLENAYKASRLENKTQVYQLAGEALREEMRVGQTLSLGKMRAAMNLAVPLKGKPFSDETFLNDPLWAFLTQEIHRKASLAGE